MVAPRHKILLDPKAKFTVAKTGDITIKAKGQTVSGTPVVWDKLLDQGATPTGPPRFTPTGYDLDGPPDSKQVRIETVRMGNLVDGTVWVNCTHTSDRRPTFDVREEIWVGATPEAWTKLAAARSSLDNGPLSEPPPGDQVRPD